MRQKNQKNYKATAIPAENPFKIKASQGLQAFSGNFQKNDHEKEIFDILKFFDTQGENFSAGISENAMQI